MGLQPGGSLRRLEPALNKTRSSKESTTKIGRGDNMIARNGNPVLLYSTKMESTDDRASDIPHAMDSRCSIRLKPALIGPRRSRKALRASPGLIGQPAQGSARPHQSTVGGQAREAWGRRGDFGVWGFRSQLQFVMIAFHRESKHEA